jgi:hypothetical protein
MSSRWVRAGRSAVLATVVMAVVASTGGATRAASISGSARASIAAGTVSSGTASSGTASSASAGRDSASPAAACPPTFDVCKRSLDHVLDIPVVISGNTTGCTFSWDIHWGDRSQGTHVIKVNPPPGAELLAKHTYFAPGTFTVTISANVTGGCATTGAIWRFELLAYVALGDSYAAGDGAGAYLNQTGFEGNECLRSRSAYPVLVEADLGNPRPAQGGPTFVFRACTRAVIGSFTSDQVTLDHATVGKQLDYVGLPVVAGVGLVTLSIGSTDAMLDAMLTYCAHRSPRQESCASHSKGAVDAALSTIEPALATLFGEVEAGTGLAPGARILVLGYPALFKAAPTRSCPTGWLRDTFQPSDMRWINSTILALDARIARAAAAAGVTYVRAYSALANHELCSSAPYLNHVVLSHGQVESFHPTIGGQERLAALIEQALKRT